MALLSTRFSKATLACLASFGLIGSAGMAFSFPAVPPPILSRPVQQPVGQQPPGQNSTGSPEPGQQEPATQGQDQDSQTFEGCGLNRDAAIVKAEVMMTQEQGDKTVQGRETLNNDQYTRTTIENSTLLVNGPVNVVSEWGSHGRVCVRIQP